MPAHGQSKQKKKQPNGSAVYRLSRNSLLPFHFAPGGRFPRARHKPLPSLRSVQCLQLVALSLCSITAPAGVAAFCFIQICLLIPIKFFYQRIRKIHFLHFFSYLQILSKTAEKTLLLLQHYAFRRKDLPSQTSGKSCLQGSVATRQMRGLDARPWQA